MIPTRQLRPDTKVEELTKLLRELALEKGPEAKLPTVRELCELFATSRVTLDEALDVLEAQNVLYRKQRSGIFVSPKILRKSVCILFNATLAMAQGTSPFWSILWMLFSQEAQRRAATRQETHNFQLVLAEEDQGSLPEEVMIMLQSRRIHGVLAIGLNIRDNDWLALSSIPVVTYAGYSSCIVEWDTDELKRLAVQSLAQQGCQKIGLWDSALTPYNDDYSYISRLLYRRGLEYYPELIKNCPDLLHNHTMTVQEQGYQLAMEVFGKPDSSRPDGLIITNDMVTDGALVALQDLDVRVGSDVKIATHINVGSPMLFGRTKNMTVIAFNPQELVTTMFSILDTLMSGQTPKERLVLLAPVIQQ